jgi:hypothetical protein
VKRLAVALFLATCLSACGSDSPAAPSAPVIAQVGGVWAYTSLLTNVSGGDCLGSTLAVSIGTTDRGTMSVTQSGSVLTGTTRSSLSGLSCSWQGTAGSSSMALSWTQCDAAIFTGLRCTSGALRDMRLVGSSISATVNGTLATGTGAETYNVFVSGTTVGAGTLTDSYTFSATRQ